MEMESCAAATPASAIMPNKQLCRGHLLLLWCAGTSFSALNRTSAKHRSFGKLFSLWLGRRGNGGRRSVEYWDGDCCLEPVLLQDSLASSALCPVAQRPRRDSSVRRRKAHALRART